MDKELPRLTAMNVSNAAYGGGLCSRGDSLTHTQYDPLIPYKPDWMKGSALFHEFKTKMKEESSPFNQLIKEQPKMTEKPQPIFRSVRVYLVDPDKKLNGYDLKERILYQGEEFLTDGTDEELFYAIPIMDLLKKHNEKREATVDKDATRKAGKDMFLEPIRIRDLKMVVSTLAEF